MWLDSEIKIGSEIAICDSNYCYHRLRYEFGTISRIGAKVVHVDVPGKGTRSFNTSNYMERANSNNKHSRHRASLLNAERARAVLVRQEQQIVINTARAALATKLVQVAQGSLNGETGPLLRQLADEADAFARLLST